MGKIISSIWQTVDGVIDAASMDKWFMPFDSETRGKYINETIHDCEVMLYGRITYFMLADYWSQQKNNEFGIADKLNSVKKYLVSNTIKKAMWGETIIIDQDINYHVQKIKSQIKGNILIQGSASLVNVLLEYKLIDELRLLVHPYIAGTGKKLFETDLDLNISLTLADQKIFDNGVLFLKYQVQS
ncbi:MAG TPA: dihydrofolate reductase family protein [Sphingobacteriaceae bacterium]